MKLYSNFLKKGVFPLADYKMKTNVMHYYNMIKRMETFSPDEIENWQNKNLRQLVRKAYFDTEYYKELFDNIGLNPEEIKSSEDLEKIPILTRDIIIENYRRLISKNIIKIPHKITSTGGTTSIPMTYILDNKSWSFSNANYIHNWEKTEYNFGDKYVALGSTSILINKPKSLKHELYYKLKNKVGLNGMNMSDQVCEEYVGLIKNKKIRYIYGYASSIYLLAKFVLRKKISLNISACFTTSELLTELFYDTILNAFECEIVNCYGAHDGGITGFAHDNNSFNVGYNSIVRQCDVDNSTLMGPILTTSLLNDAMPMINYKLGDEVKMSSVHTKYNGQIIDKVFGRTTDQIKLENGNVITTIGFHTNLFKKLPVLAFKISKVGVNELLCEIKKKNDFNNEHKGKVINILEKFAGMDCKISINFVEEFKSLNSGKIDYTIVD